MSLSYQNGIFFPLAILTGMMDSESSHLVYLFIFTLFYSAFFFSTYHFFFRGKGKKVEVKKIPSYSNR